MNTLLPDKNSKLVLFWKSCLENARAKIVGSTHYYLHIDYEKIIWLAGTMDLNELPSEFDCDFLDEVGTNPSYCTQPAFGVARPQCDEQGQSHQSHNDIGATLVASSITQNANACFVNNQEPSVIAGDVVQDVVKEGLADIVERCSAR